MNEHKGLGRSVLTEHSPARSMPNSMGTQRSEEEQQNHFSTNSLAAGSEGRERLLKGAGSLCWAGRLKVSLLLTLDTGPHVPQAPGGCSQNSEQAQHDLCPEVPLPLQEKLQGHPGSNCLKWRRVKLGRTGQFAQA